MFTRNNNPNNEFDLKEYIDYLIVEKNILSIKNIILILVGLCVIAIITISKLRINDEYVTGDHHIDDAYREEVLLDAGYSLSDIEKMSRDKKIELFNEIYYKTKGVDVGKDNILGEYPKDNANKTKNDYYKMASLGNFSEIVLDFEDKKLLYRFSETHNKKLVSIYNDAYLINKTFSEDKNHFMKKQLLHQITDPRMLLYTTLYLEREYRDEFIIDKLSLSPSLIKNYVRIDTFKSIYSSNIFEDDDFKDDSKIKDMCEYLIDGEFIFYKIGFNIDNSNLMAYMFKDISNSKLRIFGIYSQDEDGNNIYPLINQNNDVSNSDSEEYYNNSKQNFENSLEEYLSTISDENDDSSNNSSNNSNNSNSNSNNNSSSNSSEKDYGSSSSDDNSYNDSQTYEVPLED